MDFVRHWSERTENCYEQLLGWIELSARKFRDWRARYGKVNEHNYLVPRDHWLEDWEKKAIIDFYYQYCRLSKLRWMGFSKRFAQF